MRRSDMSYDQDNVFAKILRGELPCERLCGDALTLAFMDIMPQAPGHALIITREPAETIYDISPDGLAACIRMTQLVARAVRDAFNTPGMLIAQVNGAAAGQSVPHLHFHVIPRQSGEQLRPHSTVKAEAAELRDNAARIRRHLPAELR